MSEDWVGRLLGLWSRDPGRPRLTWYGADGERVELSGAVATNWVVKSANLLLEELDAGPGLRVRLDLPLHWRTVCWALAVWCVGGCVVVDDEGQAVDASITDHPTGPGADVGTVVAIALGALARRFDGPLPPGAIDAASTLSGYPDALGPVQPGEPGRVALAGPDRTWTHRELAAPATGAGRRALRPSSGTLSAIDLIEVVGLLTADGSLVLVGPGHPGGADTPQASAERSRLARIEHAELIPVR